MVLAVALPAGHGVALVAVPVAEARTTRQTEKRGTAESSVVAAFTLWTTGPAPAVDADSLRPALRTSVARKLKLGQNVFTDLSLFPPMPAAAVRRNVKQESRRVPETMESVHREAMSGVAVADFLARHTSSSISGVPHETWEARLTLGTHRVILALCARVERLRTQAVAVAVAVALKLAVGTGPGKVTGAEVRSCAGAMLARLLADRLARSPGFGEAFLAVALVT